MIAVKVTRGIVFAARFIDHSIFIHSLFWFWLVMLCSGLPQFLVFLVRYFYQRIAFFDNLA
jgi:hypothetical protein